MDEPNITPEELATFRRCTFARRVFASYPSLRAKKPLDEDGWYVSRPYTGEPFDPDEYELREGGWDHEHCDVCFATITNGMWYWPNVDPDTGQVDLCEACYPKVMKLLAVEPGPGAAAEGEP